MSMWFLIAMGREKNDIRPMLFKFGVALAISLGGAIYSFLRSKRIKPPNSPSPRPSKSDCSNVGGGKSDANSDCMSDKHEESRLCKVSAESILAALSPSSRGIGDNDGILLPEFNELVKEFDLVASRANFSHKKIGDITNPKAFTRANAEEYEREINKLKNMVRVLTEREKNLEVQLLEYCGLKEQETVVLELKNCLKLNNMEAKIFNLKIESLQADNRRLEAKVSDYAKVVTELEAVRAKIKLLKRKLKFDNEQNKDNILTLQERVRLLQEKENRAFDSDPDIFLKLQKLKDLEEEVEELRTSYNGLKVENSELAQKLEFTQSLASYVSEDREAESLKDESDNLRQQNKDLCNQIEQLQADRCADVEELVYLRWINACLRYELRNYQPVPGKTIARDLSKTISPRSEAKAKDLILEYANKEGLNVIDPDLDRWSSSQSNITESCNFEDSSIDNSSSSSTNKAKFLSKLKRLITGRDNHYNNRHHRRSSSSEKVTLTEDLGGNSSDSSTPRGQGSRFGSSSQASSRSSVDLGRLRSTKSADIRDLGVFLKKSDHVEPSAAIKRTVLGIENVSSSSGQENQASENNASELLKYAKVLKDSSSEVSRSRQSPASDYSF